VAKAHLFIMEKKQRERERKRRPSITFKGMPLVPISSH
jgi:hypothetical protein